MKIKIDVPVGTYIAAKQGFIKSGSIIAQNVVNALACGVECDESTPKQLNHNDLFDAISEAVQKAEDARKFKELKDTKAIEDAVLICNRDNKFKLKSAFPNLCILGTDACDDKVYMVLDKEIAENIRTNLKEAEKYE